MNALLSFLTPTGVAGILGALAGAIGGVLSALITGRMSHSRETRTRLFAEQKSTYATYLRVVRSLEDQAIHGGPSKDEAADNSALGQLELLASKSVRTLHSDLMKKLEGLVDARRQLIERLEVERADLPDEEVEKLNEQPVTDENFTKVHNQYKSVMEKMEAAMRRDLGVA